MKRNGRITFMSDGYFVADRDDCFEDADERMCGRAIDKLAEYEDLEEQGKLIRLPCKLGDAVYFPYRNKTVQWFIVEDFIVSKGIVGTIEICLQGKRFDGDLFGVSARAFGRSVFLTREEAEKALEDMKCHI